MYAKQIDENNALKRIGGNLIIASSTGRMVENISSTSL
jgi:hypothetical protein